MLREDSFVISLTKSAYVRVLGEYERMVVREKRDFLMKFSFFAQHTMPQLMSYLHFFEIRVIPKNVSCSATPPPPSDSLQHVIFSEGEKIESVYFLKSGEIEISKEWDVDASLLREDRWREVLPAMTGLWKNQQAIAKKSTLNKSE